MDSQGKLTVLRPGSNQWVCMPGNENIIGQADMCADPMGMRWLLDVMARKPKPSNTAGHREVETTIEFTTRATSGTSRAIDPAVSISKPEVTTPSRNTT